MPCPIATPSLSHCPEPLNYVEKSTALWCPPSPSAQHCSVRQFPHPYPDLSTDPAMPPRNTSSPLLGAAGPNLSHWGYTWELFPVSFPLPTSSQCNTTHKLASYQRNGADPALFAAPFPYHVSGLSCCLAVLVSAWLPAWLSLRVWVMHSVLTCLAFTHDMVKLYSQPHLSVRRWQQPKPGTQRKRWNFAKRKTPLFLNSFFKNVFVKVYSIKIISHGYKCDIVQILQIPL